MKNLLVLVAIATLVACCEEPEQPSSSISSPSTKDSEVIGVIPDSIAADTVGFIRFPQPVILYPVTFYYNKMDSENQSRNGCVLTITQSWTRWRVELYSPAVVTPVNSYTTQKVIVIEGCVDNGGWVYIPD